MSWVVASQYTQAAVDVGSALDLPEGWSATAGTGSVTLEPSGFARFRSWVDVPQGVAAGQYAVAVQATPASDRLAGGGGVPVVEDVVTVFVGDSAEVAATLGFALPSAADLERDGQQGAQPSDRARPTGLEVDVDADRLTVRPGESGTVTVRLENRTRSPIRGELQLASPWGSWDWLAEAVRPVAVPAGGRLEIPIRVAPPADTAPGDSWVMPKVMWFGRAQYAAAVRLEVRP